MRLVSWRDRQPEVVFTTAFFPKPRERMFDVGDRSFSARRVVSLRSRLHATTASDMQTASPAISRAFNTAYGHEEFCGDTRKVAPDRQLYLFPFVDGRDSGSASATYSAG